MKEFYVMNLDKRRIAIVAGGALFVIGLMLVIGMAIGRGQGERAARLAQEEADQKKLGMSPVTGIPSVALAAPVSPQVSSPVAPVSTVAEVKSEIPVEADPMVAGPPRRKERRKNKSSDEPVRVAKVKRKKKADTEVSGEVEHETVAKVKERSTGDGKYTIQVAAFKRSNDAKTLIEKLKEEGLKAKSEKNGNYFLVTVGKSKSKEKLEKALARLKELEYEAYIRKIKNVSEET